MAKTPFVRTGDTGKQVTDANLSVEKALRVPVFTGTPDINNNPDEDGYIGMEGGILKIYTSAGGWDDAAPGAKFSADIIVETPGGIGKYAYGSTIPCVGKTAEQILTDIVTQQIPPTYTAPAASLTGTPNPAGNYYEIGVSQAIALVLAYIQNDGGSASAYTISRNGTQVATTANFNDNQAPTTPQTITYSGNIAYGAGPLKNDNLGNPYPTGQIAAGNVNASTVVYDFIIPWLFGINDNNSGLNLYTSGTKVVQPANGTLNINFGASTAKYLWFAHDASLPDKTTWYVNALNNGNIGGGSNLFGDPVTVSVTGSGWTANLKLYISNYKTTITSPIAIN